LLVIAEVGGTAVAVGTIVGRGAGTEVTVGGAGRGVLLGTTGKGESGAAEGKVAAVVGGCATSVGIELATTVVGRGLKVAVGRGLKVGVGMFSSGEGEATTATAVLASWSAVPLR